MAGRVTSPRFIGREAELAALDAALADARNGQPTAVLISGEAGVGKSRLLDEFGARAATSGARVLIGHCVEVGEGELPYAPIAGALRMLAGELTSDDVDALLVPALGELGLVVPDGRTPEPAPAGAPAGQARLFELLLGTFGRLGSDGPVALLIEDIHWADRSTRDLLRFLIRSTTSERLVIITSYRSDDIHRRHPLRPFITELERQPRLRRVAVEPFSEEEVTEQVNAILDSPTDQRVIQRLFERSEGNAFFTEELLAASDGGELPDSLRDVLLVRLERLSERAQRVVRAAAAAGRRVDHRLLSEVAGIDDSDLLEALREAVAAQVMVTPPREQTYEFRHALVREAAYDELLPGEREQLHCAIARALGARPELAGSDATLAAELAYHWQAAREPKLALPALIAAGRAAERVYANAEAQGHYERALAIWDSTVEIDVDRPELMAMAAAAASNAGEHERAAALTRGALELVDAASEPVRASLMHLSLGRCQELGGRGTEALANYARASELMPAAATVERAHIITAEARLLALRGEMDKGRAGAEEALELARRVGAREVEANALSTLTLTLLGMGELETAVATGYESIAVAEEVGSAEHIIRAYINAGQTLESCGRLEEALEVALQGVEAARRHGGERGWGVVFAAEAATRLVAGGRVSEAEELVERSLATRPSGLFESALREAKARILMVRGDYDAARDEVARSVAGSSMDISGAIWEAPVAVVAAEIELRAGDATAALRVITTMLERMGTPEWIEFSAPLYALGAWAYAEQAGRARALKREAEVAEARAGALALAERFEERRPVAVGADTQTTAGWAGQLAAELSRLDGPGDPNLWRAARDHWDGLGYVLASTYCAWRAADALLGAEKPDRDAARELLVAAHASAVDCTAVSLQREIDDLARRARIGLAATGAEPANGAEAPSPTESAGLTPREAEVLGLVAEGRTNRQIAEALFISEKTASVHVSRILAKLDAGNRGEAGAIARRLGVRTPT